MAALSFPYRGDCSATLCLSPPSLYLHAYEIASWLARQRLAWRPVRFWLVVGRRRAIGRASEGRIQKRTEDGGGGEDKISSLLSLSVSLPLFSAPVRERVDYLEYDRHSLCLVGKEGGTNWQRWECVGNPWQLRGGLILEHCFAVERPSKFDLSLSLISPRARASPPGGIEYQRVFTIVNCSSCSLPLAGRASSYNNVSPPAPHSLRARYPVLT